MARTKGKCKVCSSDQCGEITQRIRKKEPISQISTRYGFNRKILTRHKNECMVKMLAIDDKVKDELVSDTLINLVKENVAMVRKMIIACDSYMTDPDNPGQYFLGPQAHEIEMVYRQYDKKGALLPNKEKCMLQDKIREIECSEQISVVSCNIKTSDPRDLLLKSAKKLEETAKMIMESTQRLIEFEAQKALMEQAKKKGGSVSYEKTVESMTEKVIVALKGSDTEKLSKLAGLPEL